MASKGEILIPKDSDEDDGYKKPDDGLVLVAYSRSTLDISSFDACYCEDYELAEEEVPSKTYEKRDLHRRKRDKEKVLP